MEFEFPLRNDYEVPVRYAIDFLEGRPDVNVHRVGLMGVSFGGQFAVRAAAFEPRLKAAIENCGPYNQSTNFKNRPIISRATMVHRLKAANEEDAIRKLQQFNLQGVAEKVMCPLLVIYRGDATDWYRRNRASVSRQKLAATRNSGSSRTATTSATTFRLSTDLSRPIGCAKLKA